MSCRLPGLLTSGLFLVAVISHDLSLSQMDVSPPCYSRLFFNLTHVERQLCVVNGGYAIVTKQQCGDQTNKFRSTLLKKSELLSLFANSIVFNHIQYSIV
jgi:hypothetical protein